MSQECEIKRTVIEINSEVYDLIEKLNLCPDICARELLSFYQSKSQDSLLSCEQNPQQRMLCCGIPCQDSLE